MKENKMARKEEGIVHYVAREIGEEAKHQLRGFPREFKRQLRGFGKEAGHQLTGGWGDAIARQIFGGPRRRRHYGR